MGSEITPSSEAPPPMEVQESDTPWEVGLIHIYLPRNVWHNHSRIVSAMISEILLLFNLSRHVYKVQDKMLYQIFIRLALQSHPTTHQGTNTQQSNPPSDSHHPSPLKTT